MRLAKLVCGLALLTVARPSLGVQVQVYSAQHRMAGLYTGGGYGGFPLSYYWRFYNNASCSTTAYSDLPVASSTVTAAQACDQKARQKRDELDAAAPPYTYCFTYTAAVTNTTCWYSGYGGSLYSKTYPVCNMTVQRNDVSLTTLKYPDLPPLLAALQYAPSGSLSDISHFSGESSGHRWQIAAASGSGQSISVSVGRNATVGGEFSLANVTAYSVALSNGSANGVVIPSFWDHPSWKDDQFYLWVNPLIKIYTCPDGTQKAVIENDDAAYPYCGRVRYDNGTYGPPRPAGVAAFAQMLGAQIDGLEAIPAVDLCRTPVFTALGRQECVEFSSATKVCTRYDTAAHAILSSHPLYGRAYPLDLSNIDVTSNEKGERQQRFIKVKARDTWEPETVQLDWPAFLVPMVNQMEKLAGNGRCDQSSNGKVAELSKEKFRRRFLIAQTGETYSLDLAFMASSRTCTFDWWRVGAAASQDCSGMQLEFWLDRAYGTLIGNRLSSGVGACVPGR